MKTIDRYANCISDEERDRHLYKEGFYEAIDLVVKTLYRNCVSLGCACKHVETIENLADMDDGEEEEE